MRWLLLALCFGQVAAEACSVPVFRYALDRWPADAFRLEAPAAALGTEPLATEVRNLGERSPLNLEAIPTPDPNARLLFPNRSRSEPRAAWSGGLTPESYAALTDSPARRELARRILAGDSVVWVLVESGQNEADEAAAQLLGKRLSFLESAAGLPAIDPNDPTSKLGPGPELRVKLSLLRVRRAAPEERAFLAQLAGPNGVSAFAENEPFTALVFGRGRVLGAWGAEKLSNEFVEEATLFLLGACSCEVKNQNPGWDLLMRVDWDAELHKADDARRAAPATEPKTTTPAAPQPETVTFTPTTTPPTAAAPQPRSNRMWIGVFGVIVFAFLVGKFLR